MRVLSLVTLGIVLSLLGGAEKPTSWIESNNGSIDLVGCTSGIDYQYYEVSGRNVQEVRDQLLEKGPVDLSGERRFAFAAWTLEWDWPVAPDGTRQYSEIKVSCKAQVMLPRFRPSGESDELFNKSINETLEITKRHEMHHVRHAIEGAFLLQKAIVAAAQEEKITKEKDANRIAFAVIDKVRAFDRTYDEMTHYGKTEGIWLR